MTRKLLFLDVDGVLNSTEDIGLDPPLGQNKLRSLCELVYFAKCSLILSSSWRHCPDLLVELERELSCWGLYLKGQTPINCGLRGHQILDWLLSNTSEEETQVAVLDDDPTAQLPFVPPHHDYCYFQTRMSEGLTHAIMRTIEMYFRSGGK